MTKQPQFIRNSRIKREFARLLELAVSVEPDYTEIEAIARRNGFEFNDVGNVREVRG